ncbi:MAG: thioesterase family protein [Bacteroidia bacterium]|nr:thioesterase family protein [Bacteroidia bacterium]
MGSYTHQTQLRVRYAETDQMGYVYYGVYPTYFEVGRVELVRSLGITYAELERDHGVMMPVLHLSVDYHQAARYDELLTLETTLVEVPTLRVTFEHRLYRPGGELAAQGRVVLVFVGRTTEKPVRPPAVFLQALERQVG